MQTIDLSHGWELISRSGQGELTPQDAETYSQSDSEQWRCISAMPMQVHDVLVETGEIPQPGEMGSAEKCQWVAEQDWIYRVRLTGLPSAEGFDLLCAGLDTVVDLWCDGTLLARHRSCYRPLRVALGGLDPSREHVVLLHVHAPRPYAERELAPLLSEQDRENGVDALRMLNKPRQDFGTFLGPKFTPLGVYGPVRLVAHDGIVWEEFSASMEYDPRSSVGGVTATVQGRSTISESFTAVMRLVDPNGDPVASNSVCVQPSAEQWQTTLCLSVKEPRLWYPRGMGEQPLYVLEMEVRQGEHVLETRRKEIGFRRIEHEGQFSFRINELPLRIWGVNLAPLQPGHVWDPPRAMRLLDLIEQANANMIRIWGPGQPYDNEFLLSECDRRGLLAWFEFPHEFHPHPENESFLAGCLLDAEQYVRSHRHHASVLLWCGGNEGYLTLDNAWAPEEACKANTGRGLFDVAYKQRCADLDPGRYYHPQSPSGGPYANSPHIGDTHYYRDLCLQPGMAYPTMITEHFRETIPRPWSMRHWLGEDAWPEGFVSRLQGSKSEGLMPPAWQRLFQNETLGTYMLGPLGDFYETGDSLAGLIDRLDAASMHYVRESVERMRRGYPRSAPSCRRRVHGHVWWKCNDTWPMIRNALVDAMGEPSGTYYALRRAYAPLLLSFDLDNDDHLAVWGVNDTPNRLDAVLHVERYDDQGKRLLQAAEVPVRLDPDASRVLFDASVWGSFFRNCVLAARLVDLSGTVLQETTFVVAPEFQCARQDPRLRARWTGHAVHLETETFARRVSLSARDADGGAFGWDFEDNYFDLLPGRSREISLLHVPKSGTITIRAAGMDEPIPLTI